MRANVKHWARPSCDGINAAARDAWVTATALLVVDMLNSYRHPAADRLAPNVAEIRGAHRLRTAIAALKMMQHDIKAELTDTALKTN
jgi:hypothetical protein